MKFEKAVHPFHTRPNAEIFSYLTPHGSLKVSGLLTGGPVKQKERERKPH